MEDKIPQAVRAWLYRIGTAVIPLLVFYGVLAENAAALWLGVLGAILGFGQSAMAAAHTSTHPSPPQPPDPGSSEVSRPPTSW